jgi:hypothetical protein
MIEPELITSDKLRETVEGYMHYNNKSQSLVKNSFRSSSTYNNNYDTSVLVCI